ncbi:unnamed protein product [Ceutorhynchus assimilis]|uniref:Uncharacterized protein n=1 Tax=Ceutorhynchus assimilis TaxID=467358 RepID=A0A9N9MRJ2_9CUCU|nr:unnamed protein product [Ceutorhynchus assimilis]
METRDERNIDDEDIPASRSPRHSLIPDSALSPRNSLVPDSTRSPRHSLVPGDLRSPRNSLVPDSALSPRNSLTPEQYGRSPRNSLVPDSNRSPRHSLTPESTDHLPEQRTPRGSIGPENEYDPNRSPRGSIAKNNLSGDMRCSRGSLSLTFQEPPISERRSSADNPNSRGRTTSPSYRSSSKGNINTGYGPNSGLESTGSRRASSSVSQVGLPQVSGDEHRRLCSDQKYSREMGQGLSLSMTLTTYGSVAYQLKDANLEATGTCDFVFKALKIINRTGVQFLRDCPREPNIPIYMVVGGSIGSVKMGLCLWNQLHTRHIDPSSHNNSSIASRIVSIALTLVLLAWFALGNYWILHIKYPDYAPKLFDPNRWCHRTLYVFSLVHLCIMYSVFGVLAVLVIVLAVCQIFGCECLGPARYK